MIVQPTAENIERAVSALLDGSLIGLPTETVYGLAADASNSQAIARIYETKGRPADHPLIVHVSSWQVSQAWFEFSNSVDSLGMQREAWFLALAKACWPGPLTIVAQRSALVPAFASAGQDTIGVRVPAHKTAQLVLQAFESRGGLGVAAPSANRFGKISPTTAAHVIDDLGEQCPLTLDGGSAEFGLESSIVDLSGSTPRLLRPGSFSQAVLEEILEMSLQGSDATAPKVSGSLAAHYAPNTPIEMASGTALSFRCAAAADTGAMIGVLARQSLPANLRLRGNVKWIQASSEIEEYSRNLYAILRELDRGGFDRLLIESAPEGTAWDAVRDRLKRSSVGSRKG